MEDKCYKVIYQPDFRSGILTSLPTIPEAIRRKYAAGEVVKGTFSPIFAWENEAAARRDFFLQLEQSIRLKSQVWQCEYKLHAAFNGLPKILRLELLNEKLVGQFWEKMTELSEDRKAIHAYFRDKTQAYQKHKKDHRAQVFETVPEFVILCDWLKPIKRVE